MLVYLGLDHDSAAERGAKLKALQDHFGTNDPRALNMLKPTSLSPANPDRGLNLVVNSHGNRNTFAGLSAKQFFTELTAKGFQENSFKAIYLMACNVGEQAQDNSIVDNFARDLHALFIVNGISTKIYAPCGTLTYSVVEKIRSGQKYWAVNRMYIANPERDYPLSEGMHLVM